MISPTIKFLGLKRHGRKLWEYERNGAKCVELASLDFYRDQGWDGYFSGKEDYWEIILIMMCWIKVPKMRRAAGPTGAIKWCEHIFRYAADGWLPQYSYTYQDIINHAELFEADHIDLILSDWVKTRRCFDSLDARKFECESQRILFSNRLESFFLANGGKRVFLEHLKLRFPELDNHLLRETEDFDMQYRHIFQEVSIEVLSILMAANCFVRNPNAKYRSRSNFNSWLSRVEELPSYEPFNEFKRIVERIAIVRERVDPWWEGARLDLELWRDGESASVEVKAPNDILRSHQLAQLQRDARNGRSSWILEIRETSIV